MYGRMANQTTIAFVAAETLVNHNAFKSLFFFKYIQTSKMYFTYASKDSWKVLKTKFCFRIKMVTLAVGDERTAVLHVTDVGGVDVVHVNFISPAVIVFVLYHDYYIVSFLSVTMFF